MIVDCRPLWPKGAVSPAAHWGFLAGKVRSDVVLGEPVPVLERPLLIGLRGVAIWAEQSHDTRSTVAYDDTFVHLTPDGHILVFKGSTHAFQLFSKLAPDVSGDHVGDVATINPGRYLLTYKGGRYPVFELTMPDGGKRIPCGRDTNHDGVAEAGDYAATDVLLHTGFDAPKDAEHKSSIACQTCPLSYLQLLLERGRVMDYELALASRAVELMHDFDPGTGSTEANA